MRIAILSSSPWSETATALCVQLVKAGQAPVGVISLPRLHWQTGLRKVMQWGPAAVGRYVTNQWVKRPPETAVRNEFLRPLLDHEGRLFRNVTAVSRAYGFGIFVTRDINAPATLAKSKEWRAELLIYAGGGIVRKPLIEATPLGVLNSHIALLPEVRGMSAPEWSILTGTAPGITIHLLDTGIDTGPVLLRRELRDIPRPISRLRDKLVAEGVNMLVEAAVKLDKGLISPTPQAATGSDKQYFVMHQNLADLAAARLGRQSGF
jgi:methionyl-tRNA formyltransferase